MRFTESAGAATGLTSRVLAGKIAAVAGCILSVSSYNAMADHPITDTFTGLCPADTVGQILNCTSSDITIALVTANESGAKCIHGETATLDLNTQVEINAASARHDVAGWIPTTAELGKNMLLTSANGGPAQCQSKGFHFPIGADPNGSGPIVVEDLDGDACGDVNGINDVFTRPFVNAEVSCDGTVGGAEVDAVVSWHLSGNDPVCSDHQDYGDFKKSKCSYTTSFVDLNVIGKLEVCKLAAGEDVPDFEFEIADGTVYVDDGSSITDMPNLASSPFILTAGECITFDVPTAQPEQPNEVSIFEYAVDDWSVADVSCVNNETDQPADFSDEGDGFTIQLTEGEPGVSLGQPDVTCTFTNTQGGSLTIIKDAIPDSPQDFSFDGDFTFIIDDDDNSLLSDRVVFDNLDGTYFVEETVPPGWEQTDIVCENQEGPKEFERVGSSLNVEVAPGENVSCTVTNVQRGSITVAKETFPADDLTDFTFTGDASGTINSTETITVSDLAPGTYSSVEAAIGGWDLVSIQCDDGDSTGDAGARTATFNVAPGEDVTCVFTNVKRGQIVIEKQPFGGDGTFCFNLDLTNGSFLFQTCIDTSVEPTSTFSNLQASDEVAEDTYSVTEVAQAGWENTYFTCVGDEGLEDALAIDLDPGETVNCEFENVKNARLTLRKEAIGPSDEFCFSFSSPEGGDGLCLETSGGSAEWVWEGLDTSQQGTWSIAEQGPPEPWNLVNASCDNGDDPSDIDVGPGEDITCTFVNALPIPVPVNSHWALLLLGLLLLGLARRFAPALMRK